MSDILETYKSEFDCEEYCQDYYKNGLFHPASYEELYPHDEVVFDENNGDLYIGEVWDDHDWKMCYRKSKKGLWIRYNYDGSYAACHGSLLQSTEGWYQRSSKYWGSLDPIEIWEETRNYYLINQHRYNWNVKPYLAIINQILLTKKWNGLYPKAFKTCMYISSSNNFSGRAKTNMVEIRFDDISKKYSVYFKANSFDLVSKVEYVENDLNLMIGSIDQWVRMIWVRG